MAKFDQFNLDSTEEDIVQEIRNYRSLLTVNSAEELAVYFNYLSKLLDIKQQKKLLNEQNEFNKIVTEENKKNTEINKGMLDENKKISSWTRWTAFAAFIAAFASIGALFLSDRQFNEINRPYIAANVSQLEQLNTGKVKSDLTNLSYQLIEKHLEFTIQNSGNSPAAFWIDISDFIEPGVKNFIPQENSYGVIFPGESKKVRYLLEIESHFPKSSTEKEEMKKYLKTQEAVLSGKKDYLSRIVIYYDYLNNKNEGNFRTLIDQKLPKTGFSKSEVVRMDLYSFVWVTSFDSK